VSDAPANEALVHHRVERLSHAVYGLILLTAGVGELSAHDEDPAVAAALILGGAIVLVIAHSYSAFVATMATHDELPPSSARVKNALDQLTLAIPAAVAIGILLLAEADVIGLSAAYTATITLSLVALFALGVLIGHHRRWPLPPTIVLGLVTAAVGGVVVAVEASAAH
jgi:hypothetical protein